MDSRSDKDKDFDKFKESVDARERLQKYKDEEAAALEKERLDRIEKEEESSADQESEKDNEEEETEF